MPPVVCDTCGLPKDLCVCHMMEREKQRTEKCQSLDMKIRDLFASRGLEVIEERVKALTEGKWQWTIIARKQKCKKE